MDYLTFSHRIFAKKCNFSCRTVGSHYHVCCKTTTASHWLQQFWRPSQISCLNGLLSHKEEDNIKREKIIIFREAEFPPPHTHTNNSLSPPPFLLPFYEIPPPLPYLSVARPFPVIKCWE